MLEWTKLLFETAPEKLKKNWWYIGLEPVFLFHKKSILGSTLLTRDNKSRSQSYDFEIYNYSASVVVG
jgi:hypothetical protein